MGLRFQLLLAAPALFVGTASVLAQPDYPTAHWVPPACIKYYTSGNGHKFCVIHDMEGYYASTISYFASCGTTSVSIHYLANGKKDASSDYAAGDIGQMVRESNYAWHVSCWNTWMYGTEHEG